MEERQVTVEGVTYPMLKPYLVIATENPMEQHGTYPLPEGQLDRFALTVEVGYTDARGAADIVRRQLHHHPIEDLDPVLTPEEVVQAQLAVRAVHVDQPIIDYVVSLALATRAAAEIALGASPRSMVALTRCAQARAISEGRNFVLPDDVKALAPAALAHRLIPRQVRGGAGVGRDVVRRILQEVPIPLGVVGKG
jgi:MoxR-like ATPase